MNIDSKRILLSFTAASALCAGASPVLAQETENEPTEINILSNQELNNFRLLPADETADNDEYQRVQVFQDVTLKVGRRNGLNWRPDNGPLEIGAFYRHFRGAKDGEYATGNPKAQPRSEYTIDLRLRF